MRGAGESEAAGKDRPLDETLHVDSSLYLKPRVRCTSVATDQFVHPQAWCSGNEEPYNCASMELVRNFSFRGEPIEFELSSPHILLIDPLALDGLRLDLKAISEVSRSEITESIRDLPGGLRIGHTQMSHFRPGRYRLGNEDLQETDREDDPSIFDIDSGTVCVVDLDHLGSTAKAFTWGRYDAFLRSQVGDHSIWIEMMREIGGPFFGMLNGDVSTPFRGDGSYRLKSNTPHPLNS